MLSQNAFRAVRAIEDGETLDSVAGVLAELARPLGYDRFVLFAVAATQDEAIDSIYWVSGDWFEDGTSVTAETYLHRCPVARHVFETSAPFFWTKTGAGDGVRYRVVERPRGPGLHGLQIPVFGPAGLEGAVSLGGHRISGAKDEVLALAIVGAAALRKARALTESPPGIRSGGLSSREREVLRWVAAGRRQQDIATMLGLSGRTIENHLRRIRVRLGAKTTAEAVRLAARIGVIEN